MAKAKVATSSSTTPMMRPAISPEARENQLISLANDLLEQRLRDGTASSQEVTTIIKMGCTRERLEREIMVKQKELLEAKTEQIQSTKRIEELYSKAIVAMKDYGGYQTKETEEDADEYY